MPATTHGLLRIKLFEVLVDVACEKGKESAKLNLTGLGPVREKPSQPISTNGEDPVDRPAALHGELQSSCPGVVQVTGSTDKTRSLEMLCLPRHGRSFDLKLFSQIGHPQARALNIKHVEEGHASLIDVDARLREQELVKLYLFEGSEKRVQREFDLVDRLAAFRFGRTQIRAAPLCVGHARHVTIDYLRYITYCR